MTHTEQQTLIHILGTLDGTLEPQPLEGVAWQACQQAKVAYRDCRAVHVSNPGESTAERRAHDRAVQALDQDGLVIRHGRMVGLTSEGDQQARKLAGLPTLDRCIDLLAAIATPKQGHRWDGGWISESSICGLAPLPRGVVGTERTPSNKVAVLTAHLAPLIAACLIDWRQVADLDGVVLYRCKEVEVEGAVMADAGDPAKWYKRIRRGLSIEMPGAYVGAWSAAYNQRQHAMPQRANLVHHLDLIDPP